MLVMILLGLGLIAAPVVTALLAFPWMWLWLPILIFVPGMTFQWMFSDGIEGSGGAAILAGGVIGLSQLLSLIIFVARAVRSRPRAHR